MDDAENYERFFNNLIFEIEDVLSENFTYCEIDREDIYDADKVQKLMDNAIGCLSCCPFCNRKCQLNKHEPGVVQHICNSKGHQI